MLPVNISTAKYGQSQEIKNQALNYILIGLLLMISIYYMFIFIFRSEDRSAILFSIFCFGILSYVLGMKTNLISFYYGHYINHLIVQISLILVNVIILYTRELIPSKYKKIKTSYLWAYYLIFSLSLIGLFYGIKLDPNQALVFGICIASAFLTSFILLLIFCFFYLNIEYTLLLGLYSLLVGGAIWDVINYIFRTGVYLGSYAMIVFILFHAIFLSWKNSNAHNRVKRLSKDLKKLNANLEKTVTLRTLELKEKNNAMATILTNINQGIFTIDSELKIQSEYSKYLENILELGHLADKSVKSVFLNKVEISANEASLIESSLMCIGDGDFAFTANENHLPEEIKFISAEKKEPKILEVMWEPIIVDRIIMKIMISLRDITEIRKLRLESAKRETESTKIVEIVESGLGNFKKNILSIKEHIDNSKNIILSLENKEPKLPQIKEVFRHLHTIKANARSMQLRDLVEEVHKVEQTYQNFIHTHKRDWNWNWLQLITDLDMILQIIHSYLNIFETKLGGVENIGSEYDLDKLVKNLKKIVDGGPANKDEATPALKNVRKVLIAQDYSSLSYILKHLIAAIPEVAKKLKKITPKIDWGPEKILIPNEKASVIRDIFGHLIRNSLDHGIENSQERRERDLPEAGTLKFSVNYSEGKIEISYKDDGRGLNLSDLQNNHPLRDKASDEELTELIFESGVSTAKDISDISGRGVGMDAVRHYLRKEGGDVSIKTLGIKDQNGYQKIQFKLPYLTRFLL